jgi:hypothetical protein
MSKPERGIDIGIYTTAGVLADKLEQKKGARGEATWNMKRLPVRLGQGSGPDRLYFAHGGSWRGYFRIVPEVLLNPADEEKPYSVIFDVTSWQEIDPIPVKRFRGFRYLQNMPD